MTAIFYAGAPSKGLGLSDSCHRERYFTFFLYGSAIFNYSFIPRNQSKIPWNALVAPISIDNPLGQFQEGIVQFQLLGLDRDDVDVALDQGLGQEAVVFLSV